LKSPPNEKAAGTFSAPTATPETRQQDSNGNPAELQAHTTLGMEIFRSRNLADIRNQLERKSITWFIY